MTTEELKVLKAALATASHVFADADKDHQHSAGIAYLSASKAYESARELLLHPLPNSSAFPNSSSTQNQMTTPEKLAVFEAALVRAIEARAVYDTAIDTAYTAYDTARDTAQAVYDTAEVAAYNDLQVAEDALVAARIIAIRAELPL